LFVYSGDDGFSINDSLLNSPTAGDPVLLTTGRYVLEEDDIAFADSSFVWGRKYVSENALTGSIGKAWALTLDSRILRGTTSIDYSKIEEMNNIINRMPTGEKQLDSQYESVRETGRQIRELYLEAAAKRDKRLVDYDRANVLMAKNSRALFEGSPSYYTEIGNDDLLLLDEEGAPYMAVAQGTGVWLISYNGFAIESVDGKDALETQGFVLKTSAGVKKYYDSYGLLTGIEEPSGKKIIIVRNSDGKAVQITDALNNIWEIRYDGAFISSISGPEEQELRYDYTDNILSAVTDTDGDTARYGYTENRLTKIIKPDGSYREITYGYDGENDEKKVSSIKDEEGFIERFEYNTKERIAVYINKSDIPFKYWYDEHHRTTRVEYADGKTRINNYPDADAPNSHTVNPGAGRASDGETKRARQTSDNNRKYDALGRILESVDSGGLKWTYRYTKKTPTVITPYGLERTYTYNNRKDLVNLKEVDMVTGETRELTLDYDKRHLLICKTDGEGNKTEYRYRGDESLIEKKQGSWIIQYDYDVAGNAISASYNKEGESGTVVKSITEAENPKNGIMHNIGLPMSMSGEYNVSAHTLTTNTENGKKFVYLLNAWLQPVQRVDEDGSIIKWRYDRAGRLSSLIDAEGNETRFIYNAIREIETIVHPDGSIENYNYNMLGEID
jgi:YD repeat-containing protein